MNKKIKLAALAILVLFSVMLTGCRYNMFWEKNDEVIGETDNFTISKDSSNAYYISGFTDKGLAAKVLTIPNYVNIENNSYAISYVADIFEEHSYVRKLFIEIPSDKLSINGCHSIRMIQISQKNLIKPEIFFEGLENIDIYITDSYYTYDNNSFCINNNVYYDYAPKLDLFDCLTSYEYFALGIIAISVLIALIGFIAIIKLIKTGYLDKGYKFVSVLCCIWLMAYILITSILTLMGKENIIYFKGVSFLLPFIFATISIIASDESEDGYFKLFIAGLILSGIGIVLNLIFIESYELVLAEIASIIIIAGLVSLIKKSIDAINVAYIILIVVGFLLIIPSVYLCDILLESIFSDMVSTLIFGGIFIILGIGIAAMLFGFEIGLDDSESTKSKPVPQFNGLFFSKIELSSDFFWEYKPDVSIKNNVIYISGYIKSLKTYSSKWRAEEAVEECKKEIAKSISSILLHYYADHQDSELYSLDISKISIKAEYEL